jgi:hypothetical protein
MEPELRRDAQQLTNVSVNDVLTDDNNDDNNRQFPTLDDKE